MILKNLKCGYSGHGMACGPMEGNYLAEAMVTDEETKYNYFVLCSCFMDNYKIMISEVSLFDVLLHAFDEDVDFEHEFQKLDHSLVEGYNFERLDEGLFYDADEENEEMIPQGFDLYDCPALSASRFSSAIKLTLKAVDELSEKEDPCKTDAPDFAEEYLNINIDHADIDF